MIKTIDGPMEGKIRGVHVSTNKNDGWANLLAGLGKKNIDKTENTFYNTAPEFTDNELSNMYMGEGMAKRIIDLLPKDATRAWITIPGDSEDKILKELHRLKAKEVFRQAMSWARLYRGAIIVIVEKGQKDLTKPLSTNIKEITALRVYSAARIDITTTDLIDDPGSRYFDEVEYFPIRLRSGLPLRVHASRCLIFKGEQAPDETTVDFKYKYWGIPVMMNIYDRLKNWGSVEKGIANLMLEFNISKYTLSNLAQILAQNDRASLDAIYTRMDIINASKSLLNAVLLGEGESYDRDSASIGGVDTVMDRMMISLAAVSGYPVTRLWGRSPAGMNATGESDMRQYYDDVSSVQETWEEPPLQRLVNIINVYIPVDDPTIKFNSLWQPTELEQATIGKLNAETDNIYILNGVLSAEEVTEKRFPDVAISIGSIE